MEHLRWSRSQSSGISPFLAAVSKENGSSLQPSCQRTVSSVTPTQHKKPDFQTLPETIPVLLQLFGHLHTWLGFMIIVYMDFAKRVVCFMCSHPQSCLFFLSTAFSKAKCLAADAPLVSLCVLSHSLNLTHCNKILSSLTS